MIIYVLENHWCILCTVTKSHDDRIDVDDAFVIRRWGTNQGLGQLAQGGVREETILDKQPPSTIYKNKIVFSIDCDPIWSIEHIAAHYVAKALDG
jgi:hypothetical protein